MPSLPMSWMEVPAERAIAAPLPVLQPTLWISVPTGMFASRAFGLMSASRTDVAHLQPFQ